jgi:hypothetical protein
MQVSLARGMHYARPELWRRAAERYAAETGGNYFADLLAVHRALGLALHDKPGVSAFVHLTPLRNREIVLLATEGTENKRNTVGAYPVPISPSSVPSVAEILAGPLYEVLRALIDGQEVRALNLGLALPPLAATAERWEGFPVLARLADRGAALATRNDWGAMELYASGSITADPFEVAAQLLR